MMRIQDWYVCVLKLSCMAAYIYNFKRRYELYFFLNRLF